MSYKSIQKTNFSKILATTKSKNSSWVRNAGWKQLPAVSNSDQKFVGLYAIKEYNNNFCALSATGDYTVDWGDGNVENFASGVTAEHVYSFSNTTLIYPTVDIIVAGSISYLSKPLHNFTYGTPIQLYNIVGSVGLVEGKTYYVTAFTKNSFRISETIGGTAVSISGNSTATLTDYKQAVVTVTPQAGQMLTSINVHKRHSQAGAVVYNVDWLDIAVGSPNFTDLNISAMVTPLINFLSLEQVTIVNLGNMGFLSYALSNLKALKSVIIQADTSGIVQTNNMFLNCIQLESAPLFNTANVNSMSNMFAGCTTLKSVPLFDTTKVIGMTSMFDGCSNLESVPLFNTAEVTSMATMFRGCANLESVPLLNTVKVTTMQDMFYACRRFETVPLFNTATVTTMAGMFGGCKSLKTVPLFITTNVTNMSYMFDGCSSLVSVPLFDTANMTNMSYMFSGCTNLVSIPAFNTINVTNMSFMFNTCKVSSLPIFDTLALTNASNMFQYATDLTYIPELNFSNVTSINNIFLGVTGIEKISMYGVRRGVSVGGQQLSKAALEEIFTNIGNNGYGYTIAITNNFGIDTAVTTSVTTTAQSPVVPISDTTGLTTGMFVTGTGTGITTGISATTTVATNTITFANHGLTNGSAVSFSNIGTTTGVVVNTIYYVISATTDTFQISTTTNGTVIDLTGTNSAVDIKYSAYITNIVTNTSITLSTPLATSTTSTLTFRKLDAGKALLKAWTVTY